MAEGERTRPAESLAEMRSRCKDGLERLPAHLRSMERARAAYPVTVSEALGALAEEAAKKAG